MSQSASHEGAYEMLSQFAAGVDTASALKVPVPAWEKLDQTPEEQQACLEKLREEMDAYKFSQPAVRAVFYVGQAKFLDDFLWNHIGDPVMQGRWKEKSPASYDGLFRYDYNYDRPVINGYTNDGFLLNIRETHDRKAPPKDRYAVTIGCMATLAVSHYRVNEISTDINERTGDLTKRLFITTDQFDTFDGKLAHGDTVTASGLAAYNEEIMARRKRHDQQASITLSQNSTFKPFGGHEQSIGNIQRVVRERHYLTRLAMAAGVVRDDQSVLQLPASYLHRPAA